jgi:glycosyltransferase involved in cell wall biosynthesis
MNQAHKIALCIEYPIDQFGGTEVLVRELIQGLGARYQIILVSPDEEPTIKNSSVRDKLNGHIRWEPGRISARNSRNLARALVNNGVKLAHFHFGANYAWGNRHFTKCPVLAVNRAGIPCVSTNHGAFSIMEGYCGPQRTILKWALFAPAWLNKVRIVAHLKKEVAVSRHDYNALRRWYWPVRSRFGQIYHSRIHATAAPPLGSQRSKTIICVGTIGRRKGQTFLVDAFRQISGDFPDWKLALIGRHAEDWMIRKISAVIAQNRLSDRIVLMNECADRELNQWLKTAGIFAMPSLLEGLGLSLQEALFHGCACIASSAGGITDLIQNDSNGLLVEPGNVEQLADGLKKLMSDEKLRLKLGARGPQSVLEKGMTAEGMCEEYDRLYQNLLFPER